MHLDGWDKVKLVGRRAGMAAEGRTRENFMYHNIFRCGSMSRFISVCGLVIIVLNIRCNSISRFSSVCGLVVQSSLF